MIEFNGDVIFLDGSGQVRAKNGSLSLRGDDTGTKDIIVGSGVSLRPEKDVAMDLGYWFLRWHRLWAGKIFAPSGEIGPMTFNPNVLQMSGTISITNATITANNNSWAFLNESLVFNAAADVLFGKRPRITAQNPGPGGGPSQQSVAATLADLVDNRPASGNILVDTDIAYRLGDFNKRWARIYASSGVFNSLNPFTSGTYINVHASLVPNPTNIYSLGTSALKWANLFATSGSITTLGTTTFSAANANVDNLSINTLLELIDGSSVKQDGNLTWDSSNSKLNFQNLLQMDMGNAPILNAGASTFTSADFTDTAVASTFAKRPTVNGSGVALAEENYFEVYAGRSVNFGSAVANDVLEPDTAGAAIANGDDHFITNRSVRLINFSANTQHLNGSQPADWTIRMRLNGSTTDWASGTIKFAPTNSTNLTVLRPWLGNQFIPSGSRCQVSIDNNGGATVNIVFCKAWVGLAVSGTP